MSVDSLIASRAYAGAGVPTEGQSPVAGEAKIKDNSFGDMLSGMVEDAIETGKKSEALSSASLSNEADVIDVVTAISAAEATLETVVAVRDKVIQAYDSIIRMPI